MCARRFGAYGVKATALPPFEHGFTHFRLRIHPLRIDIAELGGQAAEPGSVWLALDEARSAAIPAPVRRLLEVA